MTNCLHILSIVCLTSIICTVSKADPCNTNFGGCDKNNGMCWGTGEDTHFCTCKAGFKPDPKQSTHTCVDVDECKDKICGDNAICTNTYGSYKCLCNCGYVMDYTGTRCLDASKITDKCMVPRKCYKFTKPSQKVQFLPIYSKDYITTLRDGLRYSRNFRYRRGRRRCRRCPKGYKFNRCGFCIDVDECKRARPCSGPGSFCTNTEGAFYCGCKAPFVLGPCKERCYRREHVPLFCRRPRLSLLLRNGFKFETYNRPIVLRNYRSCAENVGTNNDTTEILDTDGDGRVDLRLEWHCSNRNAFGSISVLKKFSQRPALWASWTCWTACKATCWGGLQTRSRVCQNGLPGQTGCMGNGSEKRSCYTGPKCPYKIRRDAETLKRSELEDLMQAMKKYKKDMSATGFHNAASAHGWPLQCNRTSCCPHGAKVKFLSWHRSITLNFEQGLSRYLKDKTLGLPYWNWLRDDQTPPKWVLQELYEGEENPFANMTVLIDREGPFRHIFRGEIYRFALERTKTVWRDFASKKMKPHIMHEFGEVLENLHGGPHVAMCAEDGCDISLARLLFAGFDPLFMLHHAQVDRLWAVAQYKMAMEKLTTWTTQTALEVLEPAGDFGRRFEPFHNASLTPFQLVRATNTMYDSYYYEELTGVKYDYLGNDGFPKPGGARRRLLMRKAGDERILIGHYFREFEENVQINYYYVIEGFDAPCPEMSMLDYAGSVLRVGTSLPFNLTIPELIPIENMGPNQPGLERDFIVKACYTYNFTCREFCEEASTPKTQQQVDPITVYHIRNNPVDVFKFVWEEGRTLPEWHVNILSKTQWVYLHGERRNQTVQVQNADDYAACDSSKGRPFLCGTRSGEPCLLPSGIYYLVDSDEDLCKNGLRMTIVSRK